MSTASVYTGLWRNYNDEHLPGLGLTLTTSQAWGAVLIAFVALFVNATMVNLWSIICFIIHQSRSTPSHRSGLYHQQQAVLCNAPTTTSTIIIFLKLAWTWHGKSPTALRSSLPLTATAILYLGLLSAAGLFSSRALLKGDEVLVASDYCGLPMFTSLSSEFQTTDLVTLKWGQLTLVQSREYVRNCYTPDGIYNKETCKIYTTPVLPTSTNTTAQCPFSSDICAQSDTLEMDTGYINSNTHLGINTPKDDAVSFRTNVSCVPILAEEKYSTPWNSSEQLDSDNTVITKIRGNNYKQYSLGPSVSGNFTWLASNYSMLDTDELGRSYGLRALSSFASFHDDFTVSEFAAIDELIVPESDTTIFPLLNSVTYINSTTDPWFQATSQTDKTGLGRPQIAYFYADRVASTIACTQQIEFCAGNKCTPRVGAFQAALATSWLEGLNPRQAAVFELVNEMLNTQIGAVVSLLGTRVLLANDLVVSQLGLHYSPALSSTQWQTEMMNIFNIGLAGTQRALADFASTPDFSVLGIQERVTVNSRNYTRKPEGELKSLCSAIRVRNVRFTNFSVLGLVLILGIGLLIIGINLLVFPTAAFSLRKKYDMHEYPQKEWQEGRMFMMQRSFLVEQGIGPLQVDKNGDIPYVSESPVDHDGSESNAEDETPKTKRGYRFLRGTTV